MIPSSPQTKADNKRKLLRTGYAVTGLGLAGVAIGVGIVLDGPTLPLFGLAAIFYTALAALAAGFGMMVVAANPFDDEQLDSGDDFVVS